MCEVLNLIDGKSEGLADLCGPGDADGVLLGGLELAQVGDVDGTGRPPGLCACGGGERVGERTHLAINTDTQGLGERVCLLTTDLQKAESNLNLLPELYFAFSNTF